MKWIIALGGFLAQFVKPLFELWRERGRVKYIGAPKELKDDLQSETERLLGVSDRRSDDGVRGPDEGPSGS